MAYTAARLESTWRIAMETAYSPRYRRLRPILDNRPDRTGGDSAPVQTSDCGIRAQRRLLWQGGGRMIINEQTRRKLRLMGADGLLDVFERQNGQACAGMPWHPNTSC